MRSDAFHIGIDQGTQSSRVIVFDRRGDIVTQAQIKVAIQTLPNRFVEQDGDEILRSIKSCLDSVFRDVKPDSIVTAGLATQRSSVIAWDRGSGNPVSPLISWRDRRAAEFVTSLQTYESDIQDKSGLRLTPYYGASKIRWLLQHNESVRELLEKRKLCIGPLASYLLNRLCHNQPYVVDHANALRMQLLNQDKLVWDEELCHWFEVPSRLLPETVFTNQYFGKLQQTTITINAVNGDQTAAMYSLGKMQPGELLVNLGTGGFVLCPVAENSVTPAGLLGGLSMSDPHQTSRLIEGTINGCGAALNWYKETIDYEGPFDLDACITGYTGDLLFLNGVNGLGSPLWKELQNEFIHRESLSVIDKPDQDQAVAAVVESILFLVRLNIEKIQSVFQPQSIRLSGGLANSRQLCQRLADLCEMNVIRSDVTEATARGIAWLSSGINRAWSTDAGSEVFEPGVEEALQTRYQSFLRLVYQRLDTLPE